MSATGYPTSWSIEEAITVSYEAFVERFGADVLWIAFNALTLRPEAMRQGSANHDDQLSHYLQDPLSMKGSTLDLWLAKARSDPEQAHLLALIGVRWWLARDDLLSRPPRSRVPCVYGEGLTDHDSLQLLSQMLHRGRAPYTTCD